MIGSLQAWRFIFALMIFHHHFFIEPQVVQFGFFPVAFFFILSGYVMAMGYENKVDGPSFSYLSFIKKRLIRIYPLHLFCLILALILPVVSFIDLKSYILALPELFLVQAWLPIKGLYSLNPVSWYLSSLLLVYLCFPFLMRWLKGQYGWYTTILILIVYFVVMPFIGDEWVNYLIYVSPYFRIIDFILGMMLYLGMKANISENHRPVSATILEIIAIACAVASLIFYPYVPEKISMASLFWIPSLLLISAFVISAKWGGQFLTCLTSHFSYIWDH